MADVYYEFFQTSEQLRRVGSRGGRATARNRRQRLSVAAKEPQPHQQEPEPVAEQETVASAITLLDAHFPWLRGAEKRPHAAEACRLPLRGTYDR